ncbi:hypothetical protein D3C77_650700 [compost metagenome]
MADDVVDVQLHAVGGEGVVAGDVLGAGVAQLEVGQQRGVDRLQRRPPVGELAAEAGAGALPAAEALAGRRAVRGEDLNLAHASTPAGPRRRLPGWPRSASIWAM